MFLHPESTDPRMVVNDLTKLKDMIINGFNSDTINQQQLNKEHTDSINLINAQLEKCQHDFSSIENNIVAIHKLLIVIENDKDLSKKIMNDISEITGFLKTTKFSDNLFNARNQLNKEFFDPISKDIDKVIEILSKIYGYEEKIQVATSSIE
jgi:primosomal protein N''